MDPSNRRAPKRGLMEPDPDLVVEMDGLAIVGAFLWTVVVISGAVLIFAH